MPSLLPNCSCWKITNSNMSIPSFRHVSTRWNQRVLYYLAWLHWGSQGTPARLLFANDHFSHHSWTALLRSILRWHAFNPCQAMDSKNIYVCADTVRATTMLAWCRINRCMFVITHFMKERNEVTASIYSLTYGSFYMYIWGLAPRFWNMDFLAVV